MDQRIEVADLINKTPRIKARLDELQPSFPD